MIVLIKKISEAIGQFIGLFYSLRLAELTDAIIAHIYTGMLKGKFNHFGHGSVIAYRALKILGTKHITIGSNVQIAKDLQLTAWVSDGRIPSIVIGDNCVIRESNHITAVDSITIGNNLLTGNNVLITDNSHGASIRKMMEMPLNIRPIVSKGPVSIGNNVWLANNVCVMPGVTIGDGVVIGANSVVTHNIPSYCIAAGCPAKIIKQL